MYVKNKAHAKQYFQKSSNHDPLASLQDITENNHNNIRNDFITLFCGTIPYDKNDTDEAMSIQSDKTIL